MCVRMYLPQHTEYLWSSENNCPEPPLSSALLLGRVSAERQCAQCPGWLAHELSLASASRPV